MPKLDFEAIYCSQILLMSWKFKIILSAVVLASLMAALFHSFIRDGDSRDKRLTVYAAASLQAPLKQLADAYEHSHGVGVRMNYGSSGELEARLRLQAKLGSAQADIYIPADESFSKKSFSDGLTEEAISIASFRLVLATSLGEHTQIDSLRELATKAPGYVICSPLAGAGRVTEISLRRMGIYEEIKSGAKAIMPTVTEAAQAVKGSEEILYGIIWSSTAAQFGLDIIDTAELNLSRTQVTAARVSGSDQKGDAQKFLEFLADPENSVAVFTQFHFEPVISADSH